jgi:hypothetical protein
LRKRGVDASQLWKGQLDNFLTSLLFMFKA